jgi:hypothetical protein
MTDLIKSSSAVEEVTRKAVDDLHSVESSPFSSAAFGLLKVKISQYIIELVNESIRVAKRYQADTVSAAHVERANEYLITSTSRRMYKHLGTVGGILLGASVSNILAMITAGQYSAKATIASAVSGIIGAFLVAFHIAKD